MLNRIIKLGNKKVFRSESSATTNDPPPSVTVNHASRANPLTTPQQQQPSTTTSSHSQQPQPPPPPPPTATIEILPSLKDVSSSDRPNLVIRKLHLCCFLCDFTDPLKMVREKEIKRQTLLELLDYIQSSSAKMTEPVHFNLVRTVSVNLFRSLPPCSYENTGSIPTEVADPEEEEPYMEPSWTHLQLVYELLLRYVVSSETDSKIAKRCIDYGFVSQLVDLFESEDIREREYLKTVLHRIYSRFMGHRPFIRSAINNVFYRFAFETERHSGIPEFLEIVGSIVNGFTVPMKEEHKLFLVRALIPLHKPKCLSPYHQQLSYCTTQFVEKDYKLADTVVKGLLKYWPVTNCQKEVLFLGELEEVLELMQIAEFQRCTVPLFRQIARCLNSPHFQVAERALYLWNNENIISLIAQNRKVILPIIFKALEKNIQGHWNQAIHGLSGNVQKMFLEMDSQLFEECQRQYLQNEANIQELEEKREMTWRNMEALAAKAG